ncbi:hypothetical protein D3C72_418280 [compost metagenome]
MHRPVRRVAPQRTDQDQQQEAGRQELTTLLCKAAPQTVQLHLGVADAYRRLATDLQQAMEGDAGEDLRAELRKLIERVDFIPLGSLGKFDLRVHDNQALLTPARSQTAESPAAWELRGF